MSCDEWRERCPRKTFAHTHREWTGGGGGFSVLKSLFAQPPVCSGPEPGRPSGLCAWGSKKILLHLAHTKFSPDGERRSVPSPQKGQRSPGLALGDSACCPMPLMLAQPTLKRATSNHAHASIKPTWSSPRTASSRPVVLKTATRPESTQPITTWGASRRNIGGGGTGLLRP
jgi:hypothetical protein